MLDRQFKYSSFQESATSDRLQYVWSPPGAAGADTLELTVRRGVAPFAEMESAYMGRIDGKPMPMDRPDDRTILNG